MTVPRLVLVLKTVVPRWVLVLSIVDLVCLWVSPIVDLCLFLEARTVVCPPCLVVTRNLTELRIVPEGITLCSLMWAIPMF